MTIPGALSGAAPESYLNITLQNIEGIIMTQKVSLLGTHPEVSKQWHSVKNKDLTPMDVTKGMRKKVWWKCEKDHEWEALISSRTYGSGCPYCRGKKVSTTNNLDVNFPKIAREWNYERNDLAPKEYLRYSNKKVWWICKLNHEWETSISHRTKDGRGCPFCRKTKVSDINRLTIHANGKILAEWHSKNEKKPDNYSMGSHHKVWWICSKGHEWEASIYNRARGTGCPHCSGKRITDDNRVSIVRPELTKEWSLKNNKTLAEYSIGSHCKVLWTCSKDHEWEAVIKDRVRGKNCPYCSRQKPSDINRLDLHARQYIIDEWNNGDSISDYSYGSEKVVSWICPKNHEWECSIYKRVRKMAKCPICRESRGESQIRMWLNKKKIKYRSQMKLNKNKRWLFDFYLPDLNIAIEYDGRQHFEYVSLFHKSEEDLNVRKKVDLDKTQYCIDNCISMIRIDYKQLNNIDRCLDQSVGEYDILDSESKWFYYFTSGRYRDHIDLL